MLDSVDSLRRKRSDLQSALAEVGDLRPGSLVERYRRCGKPICHCAKPGAPGHGPCWSLSRDKDGKTVTKIIPASAVEKTRQQIDEYKRFRELTREFVEASEQVCDAQLRTADADSGPALKKNVARQRSGRRDRGRA